MGTSVFSFEDKTFVTLTIEVLLNSFVHKLLVLLVQKVVLIVYLRNKRGKDYECLAVLQTAVGN